MSALAGWYDDGSGTQRWWDGEKWTEHVAPQSAVDAAPARRQGLLGQLREVTSEAASEMRENVNSARSAIGADYREMQASAKTVEAATALYEVTSHIDGKNAKVRLWTDRIEWERGRGVSAGKVTAGILSGGTTLFLTGVRGSKDAYEMLPLNQVTSVANRKDGILYHLVEVQSAGGTVAFRVSRNEAAHFRQAILDQMRTNSAHAVVAVAAVADGQSGTATAVAAMSVAAPAVVPVQDHMAQLQQLSQLRDAGILTDDEFAAKKAEILARI